MPWRLALDLGRNTAKSLYEQVVQVPATAIDREHSQVVQVQVAIDVCLLYLGGIDLVQPVSGGDGGSQVKVEPLERVVHVAVLVDLPVGALDVIIHQPVCVQERVLGFSGFVLFVAIEDIFLGYLWAIRLDQCSFDEVLDFLDVWNVVVLFVNCSLINYKDGINYDFCYYFCLHFLNIVYE